jgi:hypothetical protein
MLRPVSRHLASPYLKQTAALRLRVFTRYAYTAAVKKEGDISSVFVSLSGASAQPLPSRFADLKVRLLAGYQEALLDSWHRLLSSLREEYSLVKALGSRVLPEIDFKDIAKSPDAFREGLKKRGTGIVRGVVSEEQALQWKESIKNYVKDNPHTKGMHLFPYRRT